MTSKDKFVLEASQSLTDELITKFDIWPLDECDCEHKYTIEQHETGHALYFGRCNHRHGYNLANIIEPAWNFNPEFVEKLINLGNKVYLDEYYKHGEDI